MELHGTGYTSRSRSRPQAVPFGGMSSITRVPGQKPVYSRNSYPVSVTGTQLTVSRDNNFYALRKILSDTNAHVNSKRAVDTLDIGGNFFTTDNKVTLSHRNFSSTVKTGFTTRSYGGPLIPIGVGQVTRLSSYWPAVTLPSDDYLYQLGATAIARCEPSNPSADLATSIAEVVREGMPSMAGSELKSLFKSIKEFRNPLSSKKRFIATPQVGKKTGSEYLNYQFGIAPILAEVRKFANAVVKSDEIMRQYDRDSGRLVRRTYQFPTEVTTEALSTQTGVPVYPTLPTPMYVAGGHLGTLKKVRTTTTEVWFSGAFMYRVPYSTIQGNTVFERDVTRARKLLGIRLDAEVLWNLAPWSWFVDWFINCSDVIHNAAAFSNDDLVMKYGYLMYKTTIQDTYTHSGIGFMDGGTGEISMTFTTTIKRRVKAHPFGFGFKEDMLTARQLAILAALGLANGRT